jgi:hypothetical protein
MLCDKEHVPVPRNVRTDWVGRVGEKGGWNAFCCFVAPKCCAYVCLCVCVPVRDFGALDIYIYIYIQY